MESTSQGLFKYGLNFELIIFSILIILEKRKTKYPPLARNLNFFTATEIIEKGILNISAFNYVCLAYFVYAMIYPTEHGLIMR